MANYQNLKAAISAAIRTNGNQEITGQVLQDVLNSIVSVIGANYTFAGVATPATNPGTPDQNVIYLAMEGGTYTNFNGTVLPAGISLLMWNGSWTSETVMYGDGGVFDISVYKSSGGTLATFADLAAALDGGNNIPESARKGGMSIKFVCSSDNKYIQARCMAQNFTTDVTQWQGVDDEPTAGSDNLVKSGAVDKSLQTGNLFVNCVDGYILGNGNIAPQNPTNLEKTSKYWGINATDTLKVISITSGDAWAAVACYDANMAYIERLVFTITNTITISGNKYTFMECNALSDNTQFIRVSARTYGMNNVWLFKTSSIEGNSAYTELKNNIENINNIFLGKVVSDINATILSSYDGRNQIEFNEDNYTLSLHIDDMIQTNRASYGLTQDHIIDISVSGSSVSKLVFNTSTKAFRALGRDTAIDDNEVVLAIIRYEPSSISERKQRIFEVSALFPYIITGANRLPFVSVPKKYFYHYGSSSSHRVIAQILFPIKDISKVDISLLSGWKVSVNGFSDYAIPTASGQGVTDSGWLSNSVKYDLHNEHSHSAKFICFVFAKTDDTSFTDNELEAAISSIRLISSNYSYDNCWSELIYTTADEMLALYEYAGNIKNVSLIYGSANVPNIDTYNKIIDFGTSGITLCIGKKTYSLGSNFRNVLFYEDGKASGAIILVFNTANSTMYSKIYTYELSKDEVIIGTFRLSYNTHEFIKASFPFDYTIDGIGINQELTVDFDATVTTANHRGYSTIAPENTLPAFRLSKKKGYNFVETDISFTSDNVPVLLHDDTINRTARTPSGQELSETIYIDEITYAAVSDIQNYDFGIWKGAQYAGTPIPSFEQFIYLCKCLGLHPYIELKNRGTNQQNVEALIDTVEKYGMKGKVTYISYYDYILSWIKNYDSEAKIGLVLSNFTETTISTLNRLKTGSNIVFLDINLSYLTNEIVISCYNNKIPVEVWVVNDNSLINSMNPYITGVTSDSLIAGKVLYNNTIN